MAQSQSTRRAVIAALLAAPVLPFGTMAAAQGSKDGDLINSWNERQSALAAIEANGCFYFADTHSPQAVRRFDAAEMKIHDLPATTIEGTILKLWVALAHSGGMMRSDEQRAQWDAIRRGDVAEVESFAEDFDFDSMMIFQSIRALSSISGA